MKVLDYFAVLLVLIGALNWGFIGAASFNLITELFGSASVATRIIYVLIGLSAVYQIGLWKGLSTRVKKR
jgi:hypothetical protein